MPRSSYPGPGQAAESKGTRDVSLQDRPSPRLESKVLLMEEPERDRLAAVIKRYAVHAREGGSLGEALCATCVDILGLEGSAIMLMAPGGTHRTLGASDEVMERIEDLQHTLGEGPCLDAFRLDVPVLVADLGADDSVATWIGFTPGALDAGAGAVFGFPLRAGAARIGALNVYARNAGQLSGDQHQDALLLADVVAHAILAIQAGADDLVGELGDIGAHQTQINQATGMVAAQLGLSTIDALGRLRAYAYASSKSVSEIAVEVISRRLRLEP